MRGHPRARAGQCFFRESQHAIGHRKGRALPRGMAGNKTAYPASPIISSRMKVLLGQQQQRRARRAVSAAGRRGWIGPIGGSSSATAAVARFFGRKRPPV